jgi:predicted NBD/HSP70 family sugar kinase
MAALGIDIGGSSIKVAILTPGAEPRTSRSARYARPDSGHIATALRDAVAELGPDAGSATNVGLCVPGVVDPSTGSIQASVNMPGLVGIPLREWLGSALGDRLGRWEITSDARAAAHDWWTVQQPAGRLLAVSIGTGVGACVLDNGTPLRVSGISSGHLGQIDVSLDDDPPTGPDGGAGSLEAYIGLPALLAGASAGAESVLNRLTLRDPPLRALTRALRIAHAIYRPQHIVLLGGVGARLTHLADALRAAVNHRLTILARPEWTLRCGNSDFHAAVGAARLALSHPERP